MVDARTPLPLDDALAIVAAAASEPLALESVPLSEARGRYLASDLHAPLDLPPFANSAMDGYALRAADTPGVLRVIGESAAGRPFDGFLAAGEAVAISTGAVFPAGADTVVPVERTVVRDPSSVEIPTQQPELANIRRAGSDVKQGQLVLRAGERLGPAQLGAAASLGYAQLQVHRRPRVAIVATGSELAAPGAALGPGQIYESNAPMLAAASVAAGAELTQGSAAPVLDAADAHATALRAALETGAEVVLTSGGVSVGPHDLVREVGRSLGIEERFWRVALRPGKPIWFGARGSTLVFGLPGNPVSALVCFELFVGPALRRLQGAALSGPAFTRARLSRPVKPNLERDELLRVVELADGAVEPLADQQSHQITALASADGLARIPRGEAELPAGSEVAYLPLG
jgi:molybdopterin molybdotransferase